MKLCKDCKWCITFFSSGQSLCTHELPKTQDVVSGEWVPIVSTQECHYIRKDTMRELCGPDADWFEPFEGKSGYIKPGTIIEIPTKRS